MSQRDADATSNQLSVGDLIIGSDGKLLSVNRDAQARETTQE